MGISAILNYVNTTVISNDICAATYSGYIDDTKICTSTTGGKGPCDVSFSPKHCSQVNFLPSSTRDMPPQLQRLQQ
jgi:hypothetical protein